MLIALLSELMAKLNHDVGSSLLTILQTHSNWKSVHRVCITRRLGLSNQIMVMSANQDGKTMAMMQEGYSCFVTSEGSLLNMPLGSSRCYPAIDEVIDSFTHSGRPPQRSILYIQKMGFQSGVCLPIWLNDQICGFFFLNSRDKEAFQEWGPIRCLILSMLASAAHWQISLKYSLPTEYRYLTELQSKSVDGKVLNVQELKNVYQLFASKFNYFSSIPHPAIEVKNQRANNSLVSHSNIVFSLLRIQQCLENPIQHIEISCDEVIDKIHIKILSKKNSGKVQLARAVLLLSNELAVLGYQLILKDESLTLTIPFDEAFADRTILYSVEKQIQEKKSQSIPPISSNKTAQAAIKPIACSSPNCFAEFSKLWHASELISLVYVSVESVEFKLEEIDILLQKARDFNAKLEVSGVLVWHSGLFVQVLEGKFEDISKVCKRIEADTRHENIQYLSIIPIKNRIFRDWDMAYADSQSLDLAVINQILRLGKSVEFGLSPKSEEVYNIILQFSHAIKEVKKKHRSV